MRRWELCARERHQDPFRYTSCVQKGAGIRQLGSPCTVCVKNMIYTTFFCVELISILQNTIVALKFCIFSVTYEMFVALLPETMTASLMPTGPDD